MLRVLVSSRTERIESSKGKEVLQAEQLPSGKKLFKSKWVYRIKYGATGATKPD